jgi:Zn-dependent metalloprotease
MSGIGATDGTWIAFESLNYLTSTSDFADARDAWEAAAAARFGEDSDQLRAVQGAWDRVGVI